VFQYIYRHCNWILPSLSHCNVFAMHTYLHIFFSLYTMTPFPTCYTTTFFFFHFRWSIPTFIQSILTFHVYTSPHIPHSTFYVITGCAEHSGAQVIFRLHAHVFCQFWFLANLGLDHIFCKHPTNEGFRKFFCNLSHAKDFVLYNQISHYLLTILTIILEIMFGLSLVYMPSN
jgi:hypothetical protein